MVSKKNTQFQGLFYPKSHFLFMKNHNNEFKWWYEFQMRADDGKPGIKCKGPPIMFLELLISWHFCNSKVHFVSASFMDINCYFVCTEINLW